jgi:pyrroline-5-carboxylate reductase
MERETKMSKTGFIGFGAMGSIMVEALVRAKALPETDIILNTRTPGKLKAFAAAHPRITAVKSVRELAEKCARVFICTGTKEVKAVLEEVTRYASPDVHVISITGAIELKCLESVFSGALTRIMPTQIAEVGEGVTLVLHNARVSPAGRSFITKAFSKIGTVKEITESQMDLAADLSGCAPAFYAAIMQNLVTVAQKHGSLTPEEIKEISLATLYGTAKLMLEKGVSFTAFIERVATPGGITEEGVKILDRTLPAVFDDVLTTTMAKRVKIRAQMRAQYGVD